MFFSSSVVAPTPSEAFLKKAFERAKARRKARRAKRKQRKTAAKAPSKCPQGCTDNRFKSKGLEPFPQGDIGNGALRVLTSLYGTCEAALPERNLHPRGYDKKRKKSYYKIREDSYHHLDASNDPNAQKSKGSVHIPGFKVPKGKRRSLREITDPKDFLNNGPYGVAVQNNVNMCPAKKHGGINPAKVPKVFGYGAGGHLNSKGEYDLFKCGDPKRASRLSSVQKAYQCGVTPQSKHAIGIDCAELVGAAAIASCKKLHKNQILDSRGFRITKGRELSTGSLVDKDILKSKGSCLANDAKLNLSSPLMPGDIIAGSHAHAVMITKVRPNPLGIEEGLAKGCDKMTIENFNFDMGHSPSHGALGPLSSSARDYAKLVKSGGNDPYPLNKILAMAKVMCHKAKRGQSSGKATSFVDQEDGAKISLLRHKSSDPACSYSADKCPKITGDSCADYCEDKGFL